MPNSYYISVVLFNHYKYLFVFVKVTFCNKLII